MEVTKVKSINQSINKSIISIKIKYICLVMQNFPREENDDILIILYR